MNPSPALMMGIDVGATSISGGLITSSGDVLTAVETPTRHRGSAVETLLTVVNDLITGARADGLDLEGIGVGLPGLVDVEKGMMVSPHNLVSEFAHVPLGDRLHAATGLPVFVDNDVNALALGEWTFGVGRGARSLALLAVGTGVGGGLILDGHLVRGQSGCAGEFGHIPIGHQDGPLCVCGARGCMVMWVGGKALEETARQHIAKGAASSLLRLAGGDPQQITAALVFEAAAAQDELARGLVDAACQALGAGIGAIMHAVDPELIVITGGVAASLARCESQIVAAIGRYALAHALARTRIRLAPTDKRQTVRGGAALVLYELRRRGGRDRHGQPA